MKSKSVILPVENKGHDFPLLPFLRTYFVEGSLEKGVVKHKLVSSHIPGKWAAVGHEVYLSEMALQASLRKTAGSSG